MCFLSFTSYSIASLLCFPNLDIKSLRDSQTIHFTKIDLCFRTSTLRWSCLFLNLLIANWEILPMFNSLFIYNNANKNINQIKLQENGCQTTKCFQTYNHFWFTSNPNKSPLIQILDHFSL
jgi:hypothetical protein